LIKARQKKTRAGGVIDRRFGENDPNMDPEEQMLERFAREKQVTVMVMNWAKGLVANEEFSFVQSRG